MILTLKCMQLRLEGGARANANTHMIDLIDQIMQRGQPQFSREAYDRLCSAVLSVIRALASPAPNAKYAARYILDIALSQCNANDFVAPAMRKMRRHGAGTMTGQRFLQLLGKPDPTEVLEICGGVLEAGTKPLVKADKLKGKATAAVDEHAISRRDRGKSDDLKGGKRKGGTNN